MHESLPSPAPELLDVTFVDWDGSRKAQLEQVPRTSTVGQMLNEAVSHLGLPLQHLYQVLASQRVHGGSGRSYPRENDLIGPAHHGRITRENKVRVQILQGIPYVVEIASFVIDNDDHDSLAYSTPFVDGICPFAPRSISTAIRSDLAKPLNIASIRWCSFSPRLRKLKCRLHFAAMARDLKK